MSSSHQTRFEAALAKAQRLISLRREIAGLEADIRKTALTLGHEGWQTTDSNYRKELLEQSGILSRALQGRL